MVCVCNNTAGPKLLSLNDSHRGFPVGLQVMSSPQTCLLQVDDTLEKCRLYDGVWLTVESIEVRGGEEEGCGLSKHMSDLYAVFVHVCR